MSKRLSTLNYLVCPNSVVIFMYIKKASVHVYIYGHTSSLVTLSSLHSYQVGVELRQAEVALRESYAVN